MDTLFGTEVICKNEKNFTDVDNDDNAHQTRSNDLISEKYGSKVNGKISHKKNVHVVSHHFWKVSHLAV